MDENNVFHLKTDSKRVENSNHIQRSISGILPISNWKRHFSGQSATLSYTIRYL